MYDCAMAEQAFLNWQFGPESAYPGKKLERQWGGFFPTGEEGDGSLKVVHEKIWVAKQGWMKEEWELGWKEMIEFYESEDFAKAREGWYGYSGRVRHLQPKVHVISICYFTVVAKSLQCRTIH